MKKVAIVTGGANGIGAAIVEQLIKDNYFVAFIDIDEANGEIMQNRLNKIKDVCKFYRLDVKNTDDIEEVIQKIDKIGTIEVLVNNAGYSQDSLIENISTEDWDNILNTHLRSSFFFIKGVTPSMKSNKYGRIINISSISAVGHRERASYCAAKSGMHGLIKSIASELGEFGITANVIAPGLIVTNMTKKTAERNNRTLEEHLQLAKEKITVKRVGTPEDISNAVSFFSKKKAGFITGQILYISGNPD
ncbi:SDR family NAD(P)-dependent oxidoreductase [Bizionia paragorgiae]|uniref:SDR family NAD(P)-dependent oxidoreductase n=1 Tax=Bizionia paragorgiae TaxID=283786 RepID=UPI003A8F0D56